MENPIPGLSLLVLKRGIAARAPLPIKSRAAILPAKIRLECLFKAATENDKELDR
jgi:hypothetical protein